MSLFGVGNLLTQIAGCCSPVPGDSIAGYITQGGDLYPPGGLEISCGCKLLNPENYQGAVGRRTKNNYRVKILLTAKIEPDCF